MHNGKNMSSAVWVLAAAILFVLGAVIGYFVGASSTGELKSELKEAEIALGEMQSEIYLLTGDPAYKDGAMAFTQMQLDDNNSALSGYGAFDWSGASEQSSQIAIELDFTAIDSNAVIAQYTWQYGDAPIDNDKLMQLMHDMALDAVIRNKAEEMCLTEQTEQDETAILAQAAQMEQSSWATEESAQEQVQIIRSDYWRQKLLSTLPKDETARQAQIDEWLNDAHVVLYPERIPR